MPGNEPFPKLALGCGVDTSMFTGDLFSIGAVNISLVSTNTPARVFADLVELLNGRGVETPRHGGSSSGASTGQLAALKTGTRTWYVGINSDDRFWLSNVGAPADPFTVGAGAGNAVWGIDLAGQASALVGGQQILVADNEWRRGTIGLDNLDCRITITPGASAAFTWPSPLYGLVMQGVPGFLREHNEGDADATAVDDNLEARCFTLDPTTYMRWGIDQFGHVYAQVPSGAALPVWIDTAFRDWLGYDGTEVGAAMVGGTTDVLRARNPARGFIVLERGAKRIVRSRLETTATARLSTGQPIGNTHSKHGTAQITFWVGGPSSTGGWPYVTPTTGVSNDLSEHWLDWLGLCPLTSPMTAYQQWGDTRRTAPQLRTTSYGKLATCEWNGRRGRLRGWRSADDSSSQGWDADGDLLTRGEVSILMDLASGS